MQSVPEDLRARFRNHAALGSPTGAPYVFAPDGRPDAFADLLDAFERLNEALNGHQPSSTTGRDEALIPRDVAYAVSEIARMLRKEGDAARATSVDIAWNAVLAGDIDELREHLQLERATES